MLQKLPKFLEVAQKTASCPKVAEQLVVDRANPRHPPIEVTPRALYSYTVRTLLRPRGLI